MPVSGHVGLTSRVISAVCAVNGVKYFSEGFIYVANDSSIERQKAVNNNEPIQYRKKSDDDWVARILEIRASDEHHVYARVYWMYWPDELPQGTHDGKKIIQGRQPYHGMSELIASNHSKQQPTLGRVEQDPLTFLRSGYHKCSFRHVTGAGEAMVRGERRGDTERVVLETGV